MRKGIEDVWRKRRQSIGLIDFIVDNDMPTSSKAIMNGLGFKKRAGIHSVLKIFNGIKAPKSKRRSNC